MIHRSLKNLLSLFLQHFHLNPHDRFTVEMGYFSGRPGSTLWSWHFSFQRVNLGRLGYAPGLKASILHWRRVKCTLFAYSLDLSGIMPISHNFLQRQSYSKTYGYNFTIAYA